MPLAAGLINLSIFGSKTDLRLSGQPSLLPDPADPRSGAHATIEGNALRASASASIGWQHCPPRCPFPGRTVGAEDRPGERAGLLARRHPRLSYPLYAAGLPVHYLPIYWR